MVTCIDASRIPGDHERPELHHHFHRRSHAPRRLSPRSTTPAAGGRRDRRAAPPRTGDEFTHWVPGIHYARIRVTELLPGKRVVWHVLDNYMSFIDDQSEWKGTEIRFELSEKDGGTEVRSLTPA